MVFGMKPGDKYYDGPVVDSGRSIEEIKDDIEREKERIKDMKWSPEMREEWYHQSEMAGGLFILIFKNCAGATEGEVRDMKIRVIHDFYDKENDLELRKVEEE